MDEDGDIFEHIVATYESTLVDSDDEDEEEEMVSLGEALRALDVLIGRAEQGDSVLMPQIRSFYAMKKGLNAEKLEGAMRRPQGTLDCWVSG